MASSFFFAQLIGFLSIEFLHKDEVPDLVTISDSVGT